MTNIENSGKHRTEMHGLSGVLTYNEITDNPALVLRVADPFPENSPAQVCGLRRSLENKNGPRPDGNPSEGLTNTIREDRMAVVINREIHRYLNEAVCERFWTKVERGLPDACWPWTAHLNHNGYGRFKVASYEGRASNRVAWVIANDRDPEPNMVVRHTCDNPGCCNPAHLLLGSQADNTQDKMERGRWRGPDQHGEANPRALLTTEQVGEIIAAIRRHESNTSIARRYPVSDSLISRIRTGRSWVREAEQFGWAPKAHLNQTAECVA